MIYFSIFILFIAVLDTLFGNRFFPSRVDVICKHRQYFVRKVHRYCFIPILQYLGHHDSERIQFNFRSNFSRAFPFTKEAAIHYAKVYSNLLDNNQESEVIWTNKKEINKEEERNLLLKQLFETSELENKLPILEKLQKLN